MKVDLVWATPGGDELIAKMARVSNTNPADAARPASKLIGYLIRHAHWSPFEMVNVCLELNCSRDISRQILRHRSFSFQEFSQRYAVVPNDPSVREARLQHPTNRQASVITEDSLVLSAFDTAQRHVWETAYAAYTSALENGVAKEQARALLPEGLSPSKMYMNGTLRSWMHFYKVRTDMSAQKEVRDIAHAAGAIIHPLFPHSWEALTA